MCPLLAYGFLAGYNPCMVIERHAPRQQKIRDALASRDNAYLNAGILGGFTAIATGFSIISSNDIFQYGAVAAGLGTLGFLYAGSKKDRFAYSLKQGPTAASERMRMVQDAKDLANKLWFVGLGSSLIPAVSAFAYFVSAPLAYGHLLPFTPNTEGILMNTAAAGLSTGALLWSRHESKRALQLQDMPDAYFGRFYQTRVLPRRDSR